MMSSSPLFRRLCLRALCWVVVCSMQAAYAADAPAAFWMYSIRPGDTLIGVADAYLERPNDWPKLQTVNLVPDPKRLVPGSRLRLPVALLKRTAVVAEVVFVQGSATRTVKGRPAQALSQDDTLQMGDIVETGADASVSLRFVDGSRLLLTPGSKLQLTEMLTLGKSGIAQTILELQGGSVDTGVAKQGKPGARYEIRTRPLNLAVRGTEFRVSLDEASQTARSEVLEGVVLATGTRGKAQALNAGFATQAKAGEPPAEPQAMAPAPDLTRLPALLERVPLRFTLPAAPGIGSYRAQVFRDRTFMQLVLDGVFANQALRWADLPDGRYVLRVRAIDRNGNEGLNADREFVLKARPEPPFINAPLDGSKAYGAETMFRWSAAVSAQTYRLQLSANADFSRLLADVAGLTKTDYAHALAPGEYYWRIAAVAAGQDQGPFSDVQHFTQREIPPSPTMEAPQANDKGMLFRWSAGAAGSQYQVQLARDPGFT